MLLLSSTDLAIGIALRTDTLRVTKENGRMGEYWAIQDNGGLIEVALSQEEADTRVADIAERIKK